MLLIISCQLHDKSIELLLGLWYITGEDEAHGILIHAADDAGSILLEGIVELIDGIA